SENQQYNLKIAAIKNENYMILDKFENRILGGRFFQVFQALQQKLRFSYSIVKPIDTTFGNRNKNGSWNGFVKKLKEKEADLAFVGMFVNYERLSAIDFSSPVSFQEITFVIKSASKTPNWSSTIKPFSVKIWIVLLSTFVVFSLALHKVVEKDFIADKININWPRRKVFWNVLCTLLYQGIQLNNVRRFRSRLLIGTWLLSVLVLISSYSGTLMSFMTSPVVEYVPKNFHELAVAIRKGEYTCGFPGNDARWRVFQNSESKIGKTIVENVIEHDNFMPGSRAMQQVLQHRFAFVANIRFIKQFIRKEEMSKYRLSDDPFVTLVQAYGMRKKLPLKKNINGVVTRLFEAGIVEKVDYSETTRLLESSEVKALSLQDLSSVL
ncbi:glutamate receptor ionotropic, kainate glr-3-like, partial [Centruroides vittatus]|uniref:glutamate receptor ionotropic, kainate glr-3-like n=1 Tax=Centruroides vittatus TaxID=120091 RepID=UPI00350F7F35